MIKLENGTIHVGHVLEQLPRLPAKSVHCIVTSPPYWTLRDYGTAPVVWPGRKGWGCHKWAEDYKGGHAWGETITGHRVTQWNRETGRKQNSSRFRESTKHGRMCGYHCGAWFGHLGIEPTLELFLEHMVLVFREVHRVLRDDGVLWVNMGDSYASTGGSGRQGKGLRHFRRNDHREEAASLACIPGGQKPKDMMGQPWALAFALRDAGWYLRSEIIWHKPNPLPGSQRDRCTTSHEHLFMFAKSRRYFFDHEAIKEEAGENTHPRGTRLSPPKEEEGAEQGFGYEGYPRSTPDLVDRRRKRDVWTIPVAQYRGSHFATFPPDLVEPCILATTSAKGCCPSCGKQWVRITKSVRIRTRPGLNSKAYDRTSGQPLEGQPEKPWNEDKVGNRDPGRHVTKTETVGWKPGCLCGNREPVPCTVLDPFFGSGTTGMVAERLGRRWLGVELSIDYTKQAVKRLRRDKWKPSGEALPLFGIGYGS